ncbi:hypothetical protein AVEN_20149-1 [Araneus ventricosus]|uniref:Uncharacterized protein n=1 Tax=Araneus ventricosus TaxID=182803 RepID=A0A4Y2I079_ARAVE|nr:hypothetical protein AVEN_20149-1 [Araneus ventricosus]
MFVLYPSCVHLRPSIHRYGGFKVALGQMTRTTPELAPPLQSSAPHQRKNVWPGYNRHQAQLYVGSLVESGFELRVHLLRIETLPLGHRGQVLFQIYLM